MTYDYDTCTLGRGRLCSVSNLLSTTSCAYTKLGQVESKTQKTAGRSYSSSYTYNLADGVTSMSYQQGAQTAKVVSYAYTQAGRVSMVTKGSLATGLAYVSSVAYWPHGAEKTLTLGSELIEETAINGRLQMTSRKATTARTQHWAIGLGIR